MHVENAVAESSRMNDEWGIFLHDAHHTRPAASTPESRSRGCGAATDTHPVFWPQSAASEAAAGWCTPDPRPDAAARRRSGWCRMGRSSLWPVPPPPPACGPTVLWRRSLRSSAAGWWPGRWGWCRTHRPLEAWFGFPAPTFTLCISSHSSDRSGAAPAAGMDAAIHLQSNSRRAAFPHRIGYDRQNPKRCFPQRITLQREKGHRLWSVKKRTI